MGRNKKIGLDYFPFDIDFFQDLKIRKLIKYQGGKAVTVYALLLCNIYKQGYYMMWDEELPFIVSEQTGFEEAYIREVIKCCLVVGLFSKDLYESEKVLTSKGTQERYQKISDLCRRNSDISEYMLISSEETTITSEEKPITSAKSTQRKEKVKETKVNRRETKEEKKTTPNGVPKKGELSLTHPDRIDFAGLMEYFNSTFNGKLQTIKSIDDKRKKAIKARATQYGKQAVFDVFQLVLKSEFLLGNNDKNWKCDFDWIFKPTNFTKILEGNYNGKRTDTTTTRRESVSRLKDLAGAILQEPEPKNG